MKDTKYWIRFVTGFISIYVVAGIIADWIKGKDPEIIFVSIPLPEEKEETIVP